jgi:hypothetical protein
VIIPGEPATFWFKVTDPDRDSFNTNNLYLSKVEYVITLEPRKNAVKLPPHLFGALGHTEAGCAVLDEHCVVEEVRRASEAAIAGGGGQRERERAAYLPGIAGDEGNPEMTARAVLVYYWSFLFREARASEASAKEGSGRIFFAVSILR